MKWNGIQKAGGYFSMVVAHFDGRVTVAVQQQDCFTMPELLNLFKLSIAQTHFEWHMIQSILVTCNDENTVHFSFIDKFLDWKRTQIGVDEVRRKAVEKKSSTTIACTIKLKRSEEKNNSPHTLLIKQILEFNFWI